MADASEHAGKFWLELREPGNSPQRKGPFRVVDTKATLREFFDARPEAFITVVTVSEGGVDFQDAPEALEMLNGRSAPIAEQHRQTSKEAHARVALADQAHALDELRARAEAAEARVGALEEAEAHTERVERLLIAASHAPILEIVAAHRQDRQGAYGELGQGGRRPRRPRRSRRPDAMSAESCGTCRFGPKQGHGECRRFPPKPGAMREWPEVHADDWCGEWKPKDAPSFSHGRRVVSPAPARRLVVEPRR